MRAHGASAGLRVFWALIGIACLGVVVAGIAAITSGGYRPERYVGGIDPVRAGMIALFGAATAAFALVGGAGLAARWSGAASVSLDTIAFWTGLAIVGGASLLFIVSLPATSAPVTVPIQITLLLYLGGGVLLVGMVRAAWPDTAAAVRRREPAFLLALALLAALVVMRLIGRA